MADEAAGTGGGDGAGWPGLVGFFYRCHSVTLDPRYSKINHVVVRSIYK